MKSRKVVSWILLALIVVLLGGVVSSAPVEEKEPDCAAIWEAKGEEFGAACFDEQHLKEKLEKELEETW